MIDPTLDHLPYLTPETRDRAIELVNAARQVGVPLIITSGRRSPEEQRRLVARGASRTLNSRHLSGDAFDVDVMGMKRDDIPRWWLSALGSYGESLGLVWGGRWAFYDGGHFELGRGTF